MTPEHAFRAYVGDPDICVAELPSGDSCNRPYADHGDVDVHISGFFAPGAEVPGTDSP